MLAETRERETTTAFRVLAAISFCHLLNDMMQSVIPAVYPILKDSYHLDFGQIGLISLTVQLTASLMQPLVGLYTDHRPTPYSLPMGMTFTMVGLILLASAPTFAMVLAAVAMVGVGSAGTFTGIGRFLKGKDAGVLMVAVEPQGSVLQGGEPGPHKVEGIGVTMVPPTFDRSVCDRVVMVVDEPALGMVKRLATEEGILAGSSAGAAVCAALDVARELGAGKRVVVVIPDSAERYLSKGLLG